MDVMEMLKHLNESDKEVWLKLESTFTSSGWKIVVEMAEDGFKQSQSRANRAQTWEENRIEVGRQMVYEDIIGMADRTYHQYSHIATEAMYDKQELEGQERIE